MFFNAGSSTALTARRIYLDMYSYTNKYIYIYIGPDIGPDLQWYLDGVTWGQFDFNRYGRHVLHQLAEDYRKSKNQFSLGIFLQAMWATYSRCTDRLDLRTRSGSISRQLFHRVVVSEWRRHLCFSMQGFRRIDVLCMYIYIYIYIYISSRVAS